MPHKYTRATSDELRVRCTGRLGCESAGLLDIRRGLQSIVNRHLVDRYTGALSETRNALTFFAYVLGKCSGRFRLRRRALPA